MKQINPLTDCTKDQGLNSASQRFKDLGSAIQPLTWKELLSQVPINRKEISLNLEHQKNET